MATHNDLPGGTAPASTTPPDTPSPATPWAADAAPAKTGRSELLERVVQGAHDTIDKLADTAAPHLERLQDTVGDTGAQWQERADAWTNGLRTTVRASPITSVAAAMAIGLLIARLAR